MTTQFSELRSTVGLGKMRFHDLRHFAATVILAGGIDVRTVAGRLGHSRPTLTLQTYTHVMDVTDRRAADILAKTLSTAPD